MANSESNFESEGYNPTDHGLWPATLDGRDDLGYPDGYFFADTTRALVNAIGDFFSRMWVIRYDENGYPRKQIRVPLKFGPRSKSFDYRREDSSGKTYYIPLPNMYYKITGMEFDSNRATSSNTVREFYMDYMINSGVDSELVEIFWRDIQPVPYNYTIDVSVKTDKFSDLLQITEQILSKFNPNSFLYIKEFWFSDIKRDIKMVLNSVTLDYSDELAEEDRRELSASLSFTLESVIYQPRVSTTYGLIEKIIAQLKPEPSGDVEEVIIDSTGS